MSDTENLHSVLEQPTENKTPGTTQSTKWNFDEDPTNTSEDGKEGSTDKKDGADKPSGKITDKAKRASARTATGMLDMLQKSICLPILSYKYKKKFTPEEITALDEKNLIDKGKEELSGDDLQLRNKWDRLMSKYEKKAAAVPLTEPEEEDLNEAFYSYFDFTETTLSPGWFVGFAVAKTLGKRVVDIVTE